jgi:hypothetical protein
MMTDECRVHVLMAEPEPTEDTWYDRLVAWVRRLFPESRDYLVNAA